MFLLFLFVCIPVDKLKFTLKRGQVKERKDKDTEDGKEDDKTDFYLFDVKTTATDHLMTNCSLAFLALQELCAQRYETSPGVQVKENSNSQYLEFSLLS